MVRLDRQLLQDRADDGLASEQRYRKIPVQRTRQPAHVAEKEGLIEPVNRADLVDPFRSGILPCERHRRVAGDELHQPKHDEGSKQDHRHDLQQPPRDA